MIVNHWPAWFRDLYGGEWPSSYCAFDLETSGFYFNADVVLEWGHVLVEDGKIKDQLNLVIDWSGQHDFWLKDRLYRLKSAMQARGKTCHSYESMRAEGMPWKEALTFIHKFITTLKGKSIPFVAHGGYTFDEKMLAANFQRMLGVRGFTFGDNLLFDTDSIEKASQLLHLPRCHPMPRDTLRSYFLRVKHTTVKGVKSNLDDHCRSKYQWEELHGIKSGDMHQAGVDAYCVHLLMEEFRKKIHAGPGPQMEYAGPKIKDPKVRQTVPPAGYVPTRKRGQRNR